MTVLDPLDLIQKLGKGARPDELGVGRTEAGYLDLRQLRLPRAKTIAKARFDGAVIEYRPGRPAIYNCVLSKVDFTGSDLTELNWGSPYTLRDAKLDQVGGRHQTFRPGHLERVTFHGSDLRDTHWGASGKPGPTLQNVDFVDADLRGSTFSHPLFQSCKFINSRLDGIDFSGGQFEDCVFEGPLREIWFHGKGRDEGPEVRDLRNTMKNVDFAKADLRFVEFLDGSDITTCKFPEKGYIRIRNPKKVFQLVHERVSRWTDKRKDKALRYVGYLVEYHFKVEVPLYVMRPEDLADHRELKGGVGTGILQDLETVLREEQEHP